MCSYLGKVFCPEFLREHQVGYEAVKHQRFVGTGSFVSVQQVITSGTAPTMALHGPTEEEQFTDDASVELGHDHGITPLVAMADLC
jgi:isocitrate lyase